MEHGEPAVGFGRPLAPGCGHLFELGAARRDELADLGDAWRTWAAVPDGWFAVLHGEVLATP